MIDIVKNYQNIKFSINNSNVNIIAISKTFSYEKIEPLIQSGHDHFGENKVQEAIRKWQIPKQNYPNLNLHMVGKLQTNKVKEAVKIFDYIHSVDNEKLVLEILKYEKFYKKKNKYFIQVNIGNENQKSGISKNNLINFYKFCKNLPINIIGLMCIPPNEKNTKKYFIELAKLNNLLKLNEISMGMSSDYLDAVQSGSTFVRIGSAIFGERVTI